MTAATATGVAGRHRPRQRPAWSAGVRSAAPYVLAFAPYGLVIGAFADQAAVSDLLGWSTAWLNYAGTSQLVLLQMLDSGAAPAAVIATVALLNLRLVAYSTALSPDWRPAPRWWTALAGYVLIDPAYVIAAEQRERDAAGDVRWRRHYYLGAAATLWATWLVVCGAGVTLGARVAALLPAGTLADLMLVTMVAMLARDRGTRVAAAAGFAFGVPAVLLPAGAGAPVAALGAVTLAALLERGLLERTPRSPQMGRSLERRGSR